MLVWMAYAMLVGALLTAAAFVADGALRGRGGATRWAWSGAMVATVGLPLLALAPTRPVGEPPAAIATNAVGLAPVYRAMVGVEAPLRAASTTTLAEPDYERILGIGWAMMSAAMLGCLLLGAAMLIRRRRGWRNESIDGVDVLVAPDAGPAAVGLLRPSIVLPVWALESDRESLRLMLSHESEHVRARDPMLLGAAAVLLAVMPWNPALWWQAARLRDAIEVDCDGRVLERHPDPRRYADVLLHVARGESRWLLASPGMARHRSLERRIRRIAGSRRWGRASLALASTAVIALVAVACGVERPAVAAVAPARANGDVAIAGSGSSTASVASSPVVAGAAGSGGAAQGSAATSGGGQRQAELAHAIARSGPSDERIREAVSERHPGLVRRHVDNVGVWVIASPNGQVLHTGSGVPYRSSRDATRELGDANGFTFSSIILTSVTTDDGEDLPVTWAILEEGVQISVTPTSGRPITCSTRRDLADHHLVIEMEDSDEGSFVVSAPNRRQGDDDVFIEVHGEGFTANCSGRPTVSLSGLPPRGFEVLIVGSAPEFRILVVRGDSRHTMRIRPGETLNSRVR